MTKAKGFRVDAGRGDDVDNDGGDGGVEDTLGLLVLLVGGGDKGVVGGGKKMALVFRGGDSRD